MTIPPGPDLLAAARTAVAESDALAAWNLFDLLPKTRRQADTPETLAVLAELAAHPIWPVRESVGGHPATPSALLVPLLDDPNDNVRHIAWSRLSAEEQATGSRIIPDEAVARLAESEAVLLLRLVAQHPAVPANRLYELVFHEDPWVRAAVLANPSCPTEARVADALQNAGSDI